MSIKLRELIRAVRSCKTAAEERAVVAQECARIRTAFKEEDIEFRNRNVAKLLFIHMLGYPSHFGQMECIKLITSPNYMDKRIGYLGLTLLLTDQEEVLMLVTNSLKVDMRSENHYVAGQSLTTVGNLATPDMARDLMMEVDRHLRGGRPYLIKKAALCCVRILRHLPEHIEDFADRIKEVLKERHHGVLVAGVQLIISVVESKPKEYAPVFADVAPLLVRLLRNLLSVGYAPEHDVAGVSDPFLQVGILRLLRVLGQHAEGVTEQMSDALAQVASNTETAKNAGNAILYECVQTIMTLDTEKGLKVLGVNILGRFLLNRDNNIRYVALNTLGKVVQIDSASVQRHRATIVECLKDPDVSIRQRALELIHQLVNETTVVNLTREMLNYLVVAIPEHRAPLCSKIAAAAERYAPDRRWRIETLITMLTIAGNHCNERITSGTIMYIGQCPEFQGQVVHRLALAVRGDLVAAPTGLIKVAVWCIGEYADMLVIAQDALAATEVGAGPCPAREAIPPEEIIDLLEDILNHHSATAALRSSTLTALAKISYRLADVLGPDGNIRVESLLEGFRSSITLELQQRSCEYLNLLAPEWSGVKKEALDRMPVMDEQAFRERRARFTMGGGMNGSDGVSSPTAPDPSAGSKSLSTSLPDTTTTAFATNGSSAGAIIGNGGGGDLLDLDDIFSGGGGGGAERSPVVAPVLAGTGGVLGSALGATSGAVAQPAGGADLLADIFAASPGLAVVAESGGAGGIGGGLGGGSGGIGLEDDEFGGFEVAPPKETKMVVFDKSGLRVEFTPTKPDPSNLSKSTIKISFTNTSSERITGLVFQAAVPKSFTMKMESLSGHELPPQSVGAVTQAIHVVNSLQGTKTLMIKLKVQYKRGGTPVSEVAQVAQFPPGF